MKCDTYLIGKGKCACGLEISQIIKNNQWIRINDSSYPIQDPHHSNRILTMNQRASIEYKKRLSNLNGYPKGK